MIAEEMIAEPTDSSANPRIFGTLSSAGSRCHLWVFFSI